MKKLLYLSLFLSACNVGTDYSASSAMSDTLVTDLEMAVALSEPQQKAKATNWRYDEKVDEMTDNKTHFAVCDALYKLNFDFPYNGGSTLSIMVRNMNHKNEVILVVDKGQFLSPYNSKVKMRFDGGEVVQYSFTEPADGSSTYIFLKPANQIIKKLLSSEKVKVEAPFYQEGKVVAEFDVSELVWEH